MIQNQNKEITCISNTNNEKSERDIKESIPFTIAFGNIVIFTILILPTQEHGISLHLFMSSLISLISVLEIYVYSSFVSLPLLLLLSCFSHV